MAVKIRLRRIGKKKEVHYRVVVSEAATSSQGTFIEALGYVNPRLDPPQVQLDETKVRLWLKRGAQPTATVKSILKRAGLLEAEKAGEESQEQESNPA